MAVPAHGPAACLPRTLTALRLSSGKAISSLANLGPALAAALPSLRALRMPVRPEVEWDADLNAHTGRLLDALRPLAGQLQVRRAGRQGTRVVPGLNVHAGCWGSGADGTALSRAAGA